MDQRTAQSSPYLPSGTLCHLCMIGVCAWLTTHANTSVPLCCAAASALLLLPNSLFLSLRAAPATYLQGRARFSHMGGRGGPLWQRLMYRQEGEEEGEGQQGREQRQERQVNGGREGGGATRTRGVLYITDVEGNTEMRKLPDGFFAFMEEVRLLLLLLLLLLDWRHSHMCIHASGRTDCEALTAVTPHLLTLHALHPRPRVPLTLLRPYHPHHAHSSIHSGDGVVPPALLPLAAPAI